MRFYETMFILKPTLTQEEIDAKIEFFKSVLTNNSAQISATLNMGMRNLAYEINKNKRGYYFVIYFTAQPTTIKELERNYRINEDVIRFIVINYRTKTEQKNWGILVDKANGKYVEPIKKPKKEIKKELKEESSEESSGENIEASDV